VSAGAEPVVCERYELRENAFSFFRRAAVYDEAGHLIWHIDYSNSARIVFRSESKSSPPQLILKAESWRDIDRLYQVSDVGTSRTVGTLRREGHRTFDPVNEWVVTDDAGREIGRLKEEVNGLPNIFKSIFHPSGEMRVWEHGFMAGQNRLARLRAGGYFLRGSLTLEFFPHAGNIYDKRLLFGLGVILRFITPRSILSSIDYDWILEKVKRFLLG
jgi:hypothetical protein